MIFLFDLLSLLTLGVAYQIGRGARYFHHRRG